uniref:Uncharacterized protein n=1 Tax=Anguilla anguilla TaxID=7936 RepID=A0A0E9XQL8_ANGAN
MRSKPWAVLAGVSLLLSTKMSRRKKKL